MPTYRYACPTCNFALEEVCSISTMEAAEAQGKTCPRCKGPLQRDYRMRRSPQFRAGIYDNISEEPLQIDNAQQLHDECEKRGLTSHYDRDMGRLFGAKQNRWI